MITYIYREQIRTIRKSNQLVAAKMKPKHCFFLIYFKKYNAPCLLMHPSPPPPKKKIYRPRPSRSRRQKARAVSTRPSKSL